ncbi:MAG TPA: rhodanese-related sulfurtransferase [Cyclobacteriaceae bacterium]|jgi:UPF0176 protein
MSVLHNKVNGKELKKALRESAQKRITLSFYKYLHILNARQFRDNLYREWSKMSVLGRVYVAAEGINAQISIPAEAKKVFQDWIDSSSLNNTYLNFAYEDDGKSFFKLKIQVKHKILADGIDAKVFDVTSPGTHLDAATFNRLTDDPETILIDMRNHYETEVGHFKNAVLPDTDTFKETLKVVEEMIAGKEDKNIVMYCTGGIRCEKASAFYKSKGFVKVFQLRGGIIKYANDAKSHGIPNKFIGKNFVFDERLGERITDDIISQCHQCGELCDTHVNCKNDACHLLFIQCEKCARKYGNCCSEECREFIQLPEDEQKRLRRGRKLNQQIFRKGRKLKMENHFLS